MSSTSDENWAARTTTRLEGLDLDQNFEECPTCAAKPGTPTLCGACLVNRRLISDLKEELRNRLGDDVREGFVSAIDARVDAGQTMETRVVDILSTDIIDASVENMVAEVTVRFKAEVLSVLRDSEDRIIDGNPSDVEVITDVWTFGRDTKSRDPNWLLVATERED